MAAIVEVLCPNGRRQKVKVTPNTKILQVLEDVCSKQDFLPADDYELKHGRKLLNITLSVRYAGLPNNAKLELVKASKARTESDVTLLLQLPTGERLQHTFSPSTYLWSIIQHWENQPNSPHQGKLSGGGEGMCPVCIYMREEVVGEYALQNTSLRQLGLTEGKAAIRLLHKAVDPDTLDKIKLKIEQEKNKKDRLAAKTQEKQNIGQEQQGSSTNEKSNSHPSPEPKCEADNQMETNEIKPQLECSNDTEPQDRMVVDQSEAKESVSQDEPMDTSGEASGSREVVAAGSSRQRDPIDMLDDLPGVSVIRPGQYVLTPEENEKARQMAAVLMPGLLPPPRSGASGQAVARKKPRVQPQPNPFEEFKFPESTKGKELYSNELSQVNKKEFKPCDREVIVYSTEKSGYNTSAAPSQTDDLPDEFFEVTDSDVRSMWADTQRRLKEQENQMLMTSAMRKLSQESKMMAKYKRAVIRISFPDRMVIQGIFRLRETVFALEKFVKDHLEDKDMKFYLYTSPPKCILQDSTQTLIEANLTPMCLVHFGSEEQKDHYLSSVAMDAATSQMEADIIVNKHMSSSEEDTPGTSGMGTSAMSSTSDYTEGGATARQPKPKSSSGRKPTGTSSSGQKVPKWFKIGK